MAERRDEQNDERGDGPGDKREPQRRRATLQHRVEFGLFRLVRWKLSLLPLSVALALGEALGWLVGRGLRVRDRVVQRNLGRAFPELGPLERNRLASRAWRHLGREGVMLFRGPGLGRAQIRAITEIEGLDDIRAALAEGRGVVLVTGHLGSWEMGGAALAAAGLPLDVVALVQGNPLFDAELRSSREALGMGVIDRGRAHRDVLRSLRAGRLVALVADQNARRGGVAVDFFGHAAPTFRGPALFALRTGAPVFFGACLRSSRHPQRYRMVLESIAFEPGDDLEHDVERLTQIHTRRLEREVRAAPDQYFWAHDRWKKRATS